MWCAAWRGRRVGLLSLIGWLTLATIAFAGKATMAAEIVPAGDRLVNLEVNKGTLVRLNRAASTVFIADPEICDVQVKSPRLIYLLGKQPGQTTLFAVDESENILANMEVAVNRNLGRLSSAVQNLYPGADINLTSLEKSVVIDGIVGNASTSEDVRRLAGQYVGQDGAVINRLGVAGPSQVNLRVRVAEISRDVEKKLGINWSAVGTAGDVGIAFATFNPFALAGALANQLAIRATPGNWDINVLLDVLSDEGLISLLAEPNLTAMSGETASFLAGGEFPILVPQGNDQVTVEFKKFGVSLAFTPTIVNSDRINLHVRPEVSQLTEEGAIDVPIGLGLGGTIRVPALKTRRAETTVELGSGQSFAIAGLLSNDSRHDISKLPWLSDVPVLGRLFSSDRFRRNETELVIIITPYVVRPSPGRMAAPTDGFAPPNDLERIFPDGTWKRNPSPGPVSTVAPDGSRLSGPMGFSLD